MGTRSVMRDDSKGMLLFLPLPNMHDNERRRPQNGFFDPAARGIAEEMDF